MDKADTVLDQIEEVLSDSDINPFHYQRGNLEILSGDEEALFAWISANYITGLFNQDADEGDS